MKIIDKYQSNSEQETIAFAKSFFQKYSKKYNFVLLTGDYGSGKSFFVSSIAKILQIKGSVTSPSFVFKNVYPNLIHYDLCNASEKQLQELKFNLLEDMNDNFVFIEWPEILYKPRKFFKNFPNCLLIKIVIIDQSTRKFLIFS